MVRYHAGQKYKMLDRSSLKSRMQIFNMILATRHVLSTRSNLGSFEGKPVFFHPLRYCNGSFSPILIVNTKRARRTVNTIYMIAELRLDTFCIYKIPSKIQRRRQGSIVCNPQLITLRLLSTRHDEYEWKVIKRGQLCVIYDDEWSNRSVIN